MKEKTKERKKERKNEQTNERTNEWTNERERLRKKERKTRERGDTTKKLPYKNAFFIVTNNKITNKFKSKSCALLYNDLLSEKNYFWCF